MKTLLASAILLTTTSTFAHDTHFSSDSCNVDLNAGLRVNKNLIEFTKHDKALYQILNNETLVVDGKSISLDGNQQALVTEYATQIRAVIPEVKILALDGINLATEGVNLAFDELLGTGNDIGAELTEQLALIKGEVEQRFSADNEFYIDERGEFADEFFGEEFEQRIEEIVEDTIQNSMGSLLIAVGQEMLFSGGDADAFEARMESFGEQIEHEMELRAEGLEQRGEALCYSVYKIDQLEQQLQLQISEMSEFDVISADINEADKI